MGTKHLSWFASRLLDVSSFLLLAMMVHVCADVGTKYIVNKPLNGTLEIVSYYYMVWSVFLPLAFVEFTRSAISVDIFYNMMPRLMRAACMGFVFITCLTTYTGLAWITGLDALTSLSRSEVVMGQVTVPIWPSRFVLPVGFSLAALVCLWHLIRLATDADARAKMLGAPPPGAGAI